MIRLLIEFNILSLTWFKICLHNIFELNYLNFDLNYFLKLWLFNVIEFQDFLKIITN